MQPCDAHSFLSHYQWDLDPDHDDQSPHPTIQYLTRTRESGKKQIKSLHSVPRCLVARGRGPDPACHLPARARKKNLARISSLRFPPSLFSSFFFSSQTEILPFSGLVSSFYSVSDFGSFALTYWLRLPKLQPQAFLTLSFENSGSSHTLS